MIEKVFTNRPWVFLDLDQTVICSEATEEFDVTKNRDKIKNFKWHSMDGYYIVFERPGLQPFLDYLFANFNVCVWTAASKDYALFIIDKILIANKKDRHLHYIFFSYHCDISKDKKKGSKDLTMLWDVYKLPHMNASNTLIIDDYDEVHNTQPENCLIAIPFEVRNDGSEKDEYLQKIIPRLKVMVDQVQNGKKIGPVLKEANANVATN